MTFLWNEYWFLPDPVGTRFDRVRDSSTWSYLFHKWRTRLNQVPTGLRVLQVLEPSHCFFKQVAAYDCDYQPIQPTY